MNNRNILDVMTILRKRATDAKLNPAVRNAYVQSYNLLVYAMKNNTDKIKEALDNVER